MPAFVNQRDLDRLREGGQNSVEFEINEEENHEESDEEQFFPPEDVLQNVYMPEEDDTDDDESTPFERLGRKMENITEDGGVKKRILKHGEGNPPPEGAIFRIHYNAFLEYADEPFDSTRLRNRPERYKLGKGQVIEGLDIAVATMKKGELSQILVGPDYAFGKLGVVPRIPPNATVMFKLELLNFVEHAGIEDYDLMTPEERDQVPFSDIVKFVDVERQLGLQQYREKAYNRAFAHYKKAATLLENRQVKDRQEDEEKGDKLCTLFTNMAVCKSKQNKFGSVIKYCSSGRQYKPNNVKLLFLQGKAFRKSSEFDAANDLLKKAQRLEPNSKDINHELQELDRDIKRFSEVEKTMYSRMFASPGQTEEESKKSNEEAQKKEDKCLKVSDTFQKMIQDKLLEFIRGDEREMPFPAYNLSVGEIECILDVCINLGLNCKQIGTGSDVRLKIVKPE